MPERESLKRLFPIFLFCIASNPLSGTFLSLYHSFYAILTICARPQTQTCELYTNTNTPVRGLLIACFEMNDMYFCS